MLHRTGHSTARRAVVDADPNGEPLPVGGLTPFSTVDCPGSLSAVVFLQGCPYRCSYCHNPKFQARRPGVMHRPQWNRFLASRSGFLDTVVFSGGEPLLHGRRLLSLAGDTVRHGYGVALHTTGYRPDVLADLLDVVRPVWVGLDLKGAPQDARAVTGGSKDPTPGFRESLALLRRRAIPVEVRTTIPSELATDDALDRLVGAYDDLAIAHPVWQPVADRGRPDPWVTLKLRRYLADRGLAGRIRLRAR